ncbi:MAG TPA: type VI secretion system tip protein TssI/VgrG [Telluria sp.]
MNLINDIAALLAGDWQGQRLLRLDFPREDGPAARMLVNSIDAEEALSRDFAFHVEVLSDDANIPINAVMGRMVTISLVRDDGTLRYFNGYVTQFGFTKTDGGFAHYRMVLSPWLAFLRLRQDCRLFQNMNLVEICDKTFENYLQRDFQCRLIQQLPDITLAVQYNETDHNHIHRRLEDAGLFYWYEHRYDGHTLWVSDDSTYANPLDGDASTIEYRAESGSIEDDGISHWMPAQVACPMQSTVGSYNFKHASAANAEGSALFDQGSVPQHEVFESTGAYGFADPTAGEALAQRRMDQLAVEASTVTTRGNHRALQPGRSFALAGHFFSEGDGGEHLVVSVRHVASNNYQNNDTSRSEYANEMKCVRKSAHWRPPRGYHSTDTRIYGVQTATVVGPPGEEIYTDEYGRVRVQFHWDREGKTDPTSSPWMRIATTWAGSQFGQVNLPRVGDEVLVQFLEGNCDRPLIVGAVVNTKRMPNW